MLEYLIEDIMEDFKKDEYDPDEFYEEAVAHLAAYGYDINHEIVWELDEDRASNIRGDHLEIIAEIEYEENSTYLRFVLEDGRSEMNVPAVDRVRGPEDFDLQTDYQKQQL